MDAGITLKVIDPGSGVISQLSFSPGGQFRIAANGNAFVGPIDLGTADGTGVAENPVIVPPVTELSPSVISASPSAWLNPTSPPIAVASIAPSIQPIQPPSVSAISPSNPFILPSSQPTTPAAVGLVNSSPAVPAISATSFTTSSLLPPLSTVTASGLATSSVLVTSSVHVAAISSAHTVPAISQTPLAVSSKSSASVVSNTQLLRTTTNAPFHSTTSLAAKSSLRPSLSASASHATQSLLSKSATSSSKGHSSNVHPTTSASSSYIPTSLPITRSDLVSVSAPAPSESASSLPLPLVPPKSAANLSTHGPLYLGIALAVLPTIAIILAVIAWYIRRRYRNKRDKRRRAEDVVVPWAQPGDEEDSVGYSSMERAAAGSAIYPNVDLRQYGGVFSSREELADAQAWSPTGDRDVGDPRRAPVPRTNEASFNDSVYSLNGHPIPGHGLFSHDHDTTALGASFSNGSNGSTAPLRPRNTLRQLPSHLIDSEASSRAVEEQYGRFGGRPTRLGSIMESDNPYLSSSNLASMANRYPHPQPRSNMVERLRNLGNQPTRSETEWDRLPTPGRNALKEETEPWAASFKTSLVNAFNAVASGISGAPTMPSEFGRRGPQAGLETQTGTETEEDKLEKLDKFTRSPTRRLTRLSLAGKTSASLTRGMSSASHKSKNWVLEENDDGTGVVHFLPRLDKDQPPAAAAADLAFYDEPDEKISKHWNDSDNRSRSSEDSDSEKPKIPLRVASNVIPARAVVRSDTNLSISRPNSSFSLASSVYSSADPPRLPNVRTLTRASMEPLAEDDVVVIRPGSVPND